MRNEFDSPYTSCKFMPKIHPGDVVHLKQYEDMKRMGGFIPDQVPFCDKDVIVRDVHNRTDKTWYYHIDGSTWWFYPDFIEYVVQDEDIDSGDINIEDLFDF